MAGLSFSAAKQNDTWAQRGYPSYLLPFFRQFDALREQSGEDITDQDLLFRTLINPKPLQAFFAEYLAKENLHLQARAYQGETQTPVTQIFRDILLVVTRNANGLMTDFDMDNPEWVRQLGMLPFTASQIEKISKGIRDPYIVATAAVLQSGMNNYFSELCAILDADFDLSASNSVAMKRLGIGIRSQSFWTEFLPMLAVTYDANQDASDPFTQTLNTAWRNQAFQTKDSQGEVNKCPARFMVRHLMNTDFIEQSDGSLSAAPESRDGAMLSLIYNRLRAQQHLEPLPGHTLLLLT